MDCKGPGGVQTADFKTSLSYRIHPHSQIFTLGLRFLNHLMIPQQSINSTAFLRCLVTSWSASFPGPGRRIPSSDRSMSWRDPSDQHPPLVRSQAPGLGIFSWDWDGLALWIGWVDDWMIGWWMEMGNKNSYLGFALVHNGDIWCYFATV